MNYQFSKDYELLWKLAQEQEVICFKCKHVLYAIKNNSDTTALVTGNGFCYSDTDNISHFIDACKHYEIKFLIPGEVNELVDVLRVITRDYFGELVRSGIHAKPGLLPEKPIIKKAKELLKKYEVDNG